MAKSPTSFFLCTIPDSELYPPPKKVPKVPKVLKVPKVPKVPNFFWGV